MSHPVGHSMAWVAPARPTMAAGALFLTVGARVLLVKPTYKPGWELPGGIVEPGESPAVACARELSEELGVALVPGRLLVVDWAPEPQVGDKVLWLFDGGRLDATTLAAVHLPPAELAYARWVALSELDRHVSPRLARRIVLAVRALADGTTIYAEHGMPQQRHG